MNLLLPKHYIQSLLFVCLLIAPKLLFGQYILDKQVKFEEKKGTQSIIPPIKSFYAKGDKLYFVANNSITITDNNGLLVDKIPVTAKDNWEHFIPFDNFPVDGENNFYIYDSLNHIKKYTKDRVLLNMVDLSEYTNYIGSYNQMAIDNENNIYINSGDRVTVINKDGVWLRHIRLEGIRDGNNMGDIINIIVSNSGTIYVGYITYSNYVVEIFNKEGIPLRKIDLKERGNIVGFDNDDTVYILNHLDNNIYPYDKTGKALPSLTVSNNKNNSPFNIVKKSDNKLIAYCYNRESMEYAYYDVDTKTKSNVIITTDEADYPVGILDAQINPITKNITFLDKYKVITYDKDYNVVKSAKNFDKGVVNKNLPQLFSFDGNGKSFFLKMLYSKQFEYEIYSEASADLPLCKIVADTVVNKILIEKDSINNPIIVVATSKSISSYSFSGDFIKKIITPTKGFISMFNKNSDGTYSLFSSYLRVLEKYDSNFKLISSKYYEGGGDDFTVTTDGYSHAVRRWNWMDNHFVLLELYNSEGKNVSSTIFDFNYPSGSLIRTFNNQLIIAGIGTNYFSVVNFKYDDKLKPNFIKIPTKINLTTLDKGLDLSTQFSSYAQNLSYKLLNGECIKVSSAGILDVIKAGTAIIELTSPATSIYNASSSKVEVIVTKVNPKVTGIDNIEKKIGDSDFLLDIKSDSPVQPTLLIVSGKSVSLDPQTKKIKIIKEGLSIVKVFYPETDIYNGYFTTISVAVTSSLGTVAKLSPELTAVDVTKKITDADFNLVVNTKSYYPLNFLVVEGDAIEVSALGKIRILKAGITKVKISETETATYQSAEVFVTVTIEKLDQAIDAGTVPTSLYLNSTGFDINPTSNSGLGVSTKIVSGPAKLEGKRVALLGNAGVIELEFSQAGDTKYKAATTLKKSVEVKLVLANLEEPSDKSVKVFPNPITTTLQLRSDGKPFGVKVVSMLGSVVLEKEIAKEETEIDLSGIKPGNYVLIIQKNNQLQYIKIQKQ